MIFHRRKVHVRVQYIRNVQTTGAKALSQPSSHKRVNVSLDMYKLINVFRYVQINKYN